MVRVPVANANMKAIFKPLFTSHLFYPISQKNKTKHGQAQSQYAIALPKDVDTEGHEKLGPLVQLVNHSDITQICWFFWDLASSSKKMETVIVIGWFMSPKTILRSPNLWYLWMVSDIIVKMRSLRWAPIQYGWCPYKKRKRPCEDRHIEGEHHLMMRADIVMIELQAHECWGLTATTRS